MRNPRPRVSEVRERICHIVSEEPGIHFRGLGRQANITSAGQLRHHLDRLNRMGRLVEVEDGRYKRFFVAGEQDPQARPEIARFSRVVPRRIAKLLLARPMNRTELRRSLGCADSTLGYHLARMVELGDLAKTRGSNCCNYSLTSKDFVRKIIMGQTSRLPPTTAPTNMLANRYARIRQAYVEECRSSPVERQANHAPVGGAPDTANAATSPPTARDSVSDPAPAAPDPPQRSLGE